MATAIVFVLLTFNLYFCYANYTNSQCGRSPMHRGKRMIRGGDLTNPSDYPFIVGVVHYSNDSYGKCTGALINPNYVLTAAHCYEKDSELKIAFKTKKLRNWPNELTIPGKMILHPKFELSKCIIKSNLLTKTI